MEARKKEISAIPERKRKRLEKKMKKAEAFLVLANSNDTAKKEKKDLNSDSDSDEEKPKSKLKNKSIPELSSAETAMTEVEIRSAIDKQKEQIIARQKRSMARPKIFLTLENISHSFDPRVDLDKQERRPLYIMDVQQLLLFAVQGQYASYKPVWCKMLRHGKLNRTCFVILDHVTSQDYKENADCFPYLRGLVPEVAIEFTPPERYRGSLIADLLTVPLSPQQIAVRYEKQIRQARKQVQALSEGGATEATPADDSESDKALRSYLLSIKNDALEKTYLLLSTEQMIQENYPVPTIGSQFDQFVYSQEKYAEVTDQSPIFAVDCEMCQTSGNQSELTRVSVVNEEMECIYDTYVKPRNRITDYLTKYSGITKQILDPVTTRIEDVQEDIRRLLPPNAILAGQSLCFDLKALKMFHPYVIDTSVIYNVSGQRRMKTSLKNLAQIFLGKSIQKDGKKGHSSVEDATTTMELVVLKLRNGLGFGDMSVSSTPLKQQLRELNDDKARHQKTASDSSSVASAPSGDCENGRKRTLSTEKSDNVVIKKAKADDDESGTDEIGEESVPPSSQECSDRLKSSQTVSRPMESNKPISVAERGRRATFMNNRAKFTEDFFQLLAETGKTMGVVDSPVLREKYKSDWLEANLIGTGKTKRLTENACAEVKVKDFTWVRYSGSSDEKQKTLRKLDKQMEKVRASLPECSMLVVLLSGNAEHDGMIFVHVT